MEDNTKPFSQSLYDQNNRRAIDTAIEYFTQKGYEIVVPDSEQYSDYDILAKVGDTLVPIELEVKKVWDLHGVWNPQWPTLDIPYRKSYSRAKMFVMFNNHHDSLIRLNMDRVKKSRVIYKDTIYTRNEPFFAVEVIGCRVEHRIDGKWQ